MAASVSVILTNVTPDNPTYCWEFFGPVSMLFRAKDEADAVRIANDSPFGLGGSVFISNTAHWTEVAAEISTSIGSRQTDRTFAFNIPYRCDTSYFGGIVQGEAEVRDSLLWTERNETVLRDFTLLTIS